MYVSSAAAFEASTDTSVDDQQRDGSQEALEVCNEGDEISVAQKRILRSRQEQIRQLQSQPKQIMDKLKNGRLNSDPVDQRCDQGLFSAESNKGAATPGKQAESLKAEIQQGSAEYLQQQGQTCQQQNCKQMQKPLVSQHSGQQGQTPQQATSMDPLYQQGQRYGNGGQYQQVRLEELDLTFNNYY